MIRFFSKSRLAVVQFVFLFSSLALASTSSVDFFMHENSLATRYKYQKDTKGLEKSNDAEYHLDIGGGVGFLEKMLRFEFNARTGKSYQSSWSKTGLGHAKGEFDFHVRHLWMAIDLTKDLSIYGGSLRNVYGAGTESTSFDADGWTSGYRLAHQMNQLKFEFTGGFLGSFNTPSYFERFDDMGEFNFFHTMLTYKTESKNVGSLAHIYNLTNKAVHYVQAAFTKNYNDGKQFVIIEDTAAVTANHGNVFGLTMGTKFSKAVAEKDMKVSLAYFHKTPSFILPLNDKIFDKHSAWLAVKFPEFWHGGEFYTGELFINYLRSFSYSKQYRAELGLNLKF